MSLLFANILLFVAAAAAHVPVGPVSGSSLAQGGNAAISGDVTARRLNNVRKCDQFAGANAGARLVACIADLPAAGGTVDARGFEGAQTIYTDVFTFVIKNVMLHFGAGQFAFALDTTIPANISIVMAQGGTLEPASGKTLTIKGAIQAPVSQIFSGSGTISFTGNQRIERVLPQWWGAVGDAATDDQPAIQKAVDAAGTLGNSSTKGGEVFFPSGWYRTKNPIVLPRSGLNSTRVVWLRGENERTTRIGHPSATSFPAGRGLIEWEAMAERAWLQSIENITLTLPNVAGVMGIYFTPTWAHRRIVGDAAISASDATLTSATAAFTSADVGKVIFVFGAGEDSGVLRSFIRSYTSGTEVELEDNASTTVSAANAMFHTPSNSAYTTITSGAITADTTTLTSSAAFSGGDVGKHILIARAGHGGLPWPTRIASFTNSSSVEVVSAPPVTVSSALVNLYTSSPTTGLEKSQFTIRNVTVEGSNECHFASILLGGFVQHSLIEQFSHDPSIGTWKQDTIGLMVDEIIAESSAAASFGNQFGGFEYGTLRNFSAGVRRGGHPQALRGRFNYVQMSQVMVGTPTLTQPHFEFINSTKVSVDTMTNEGSGAKGVIKLVASHQMTFDNWAMGAAANGGKGYGDGVVLIGTTDTRWTNGPLRSPVSIEDFSDHGKFLFTLDTHSHRNLFYGVLISLGETMASEISDSGTDNYFEGAQWTAKRTATFAHSGTRSAGNLQVFGTLLPDTTGDALGSSTKQWQVYTEVISTASLPGAGASMDGTIIIEDAGAGDRNIIIYAGAQRFRIDGGAAF